MESLELFSRGLFQKLDELPWFHAESARLAEKYGLDGEKMMKAIITVLFRRVLSGKTDEEMAAGAKAQGKVDARYWEQETSWTLILSRPFGLGRIWEGDQVTFHQQPHHAVLATQL